MTVTTKVRFSTSKAGRKRLNTDALRLVLPGRVPRMSKLMALAIRFDDLVQTGTASDYSELARLAKVSQPRMTQIMNLLHLAPDIQEELLFLPLVVEGRDLIHERMMREICAEVGWREQRLIWTAPR